LFSRETSNVVGGAKFLGGALGKIPIDYATPEACSLVALLLQDESGGNTPVATLTVADDFRTLVGPEFVRSGAELLERNVKRPFDVLEAAFPIRADIQKDHPVVPVQLSCHLPRRIPRDGSSPYKSCYVREKY
jgi:hypothetical protein